MSEDGELPEGWAETTLGTHVYLAGRIGWRGLKAEEYTPTGPLLLSTYNLNYGEVVDYRDANHISRIRYDESPEITVRESDILLTKDGAGIGKLAIVKGLPGDATINSSLLLIRPSQVLVPKFLFYCLAGPGLQRIAQERITGSATPHLFQRDIKTFEVAVAPLPEQHRIVEQVEALLAQLNKAKDRLARVKVILKRFRQTVLAAACSGKLTEEWRAARGQEDLEWPISTVEQVSQGIVDCPHSTPKWTDRGEVCLRTTNFFVTGLDLREVRYVSTATFNERVSRLVPLAGDIVYSREGGILGIACVIPRELRACLGQRMMLMRPDPQKIRSAYLCAILNSPATNATVRELTGGSAAPHLNVGDIKKFDVPLPSLEEQDHALERMTQLLRLADTIEVRLAAATTGAAKLPQSILSKAFRGELVPTEAELARQEGRTFETATDLLARLGHTPPLSGRRANGASSKGRAGRRPR